MGGGSVGFVLRELGRNLLISMGGPYKFSRSRGEMLK